MRGFTLIEMLVVLAIVAIISTIVLSGQSEFNRAVVINDTAYTVALSLKEAQSYGISSQTFSSVSNPAYGISFSNATPDTYTLFADVVPASPGDSLGTLCPGHTTASGPQAHAGNCVYTDAVNELVRTYTLTHGFTVSDFCVQDGAGVITYCTSTGTLTKVDISFLRAATSATIIGTHGAATYAQAFAKAIIKVSAPAGGDRCVVVTSLGQISVAQACP